MRMARNHFEFIEDPLIVGYVRKIGNKIISVLPRKHFNYHFYVIKEDVYNAFATPGGHVFINSGLLDAMDSEAELAGILAHEIAHVFCRHISHNIERSSKISMMTVAGIAAGILLGLSGAGEAASAMALGSVAAGQSAVLAYSREDEMQADQIGVKYLIKAGYKVDGLISILKKIRSKQWFGTKHIPTYLTTHPASDERLSYIGSFLDDDLKTENQVKKNESVFQRVQLRLATGYGDEQVMLDKFSKNVIDNPEDPVAHYGYGLILARSGNRKEAVNHLKTALGKRAFDTDILKDIGRIYFFDGRFTDALKTLESIMDISPNSECLFFLGRTQLKLEMYNEAVISFERIIQEDPAFIEAFYFLGEAYSKKDRQDKSHYFLGIYYNKKNSYKNAIFHLTRALEIYKDPGTKLEIKKMLRKIKKKSKTEGQG